MNKTNETIRLLILHESQDEAEQIINALRNSGHATRATQITSEEEFIDQLKQHSWDLLLARPDADGISAEIAISHIKRMEKDIPVIILADDNDSDFVTQGLQSGASDVVPAEEIERFILVVKRELKNHAERRGRRKADLALKEAEKRCDMLLDSSRDAITYVVDGMHIYANQSYIEMFGYDDPDDFEGVPMIDMVTSSDQKKLKQFLKTYAETEDKEEEEEFRCKGIRTDDTEINLNMIFSPAHYDGEPCTQIVIRAAIGDEKLEEKLKEISSQDLLTSLYNRQYFIKKLDHCVEKAVEGGEAYALFYLNLDGFGKIKSQVSIAGADLVLSDVATLLRQELGEDIILARFGEDVFTFIYPQDDPELAIEYGKKLCAAIENHLSEVQGRTLQVTASIGIAMINDSSPSTEELITRAHFASDKVREEDETANGNGVHLHSTIEDSEENAQGGQKQHTKAQLQKAIDGGMFKILFQPIISLRGDSSEFYEVLLRMIDDSGKDISPDKFLATAAVSKQAEKIDRWVIIQSVRTLVERRRSGVDTHIIINLTPQTLKDPTFLPWLSVALKAARIPSDCLTFQIAETDATTYLKQTKAFTKGVAELHCTTSISRFGGSINPFNALKHITADYLKIDGSFIQDINNPEAKEALKELVSTAHSHGKRTIMPMVESASALSALWQIGVNYIQGYYLQPPLEKMNYDFSHEE